MKKKKKKKSALDLGALGLEDDDGAPSGPPLVIAEVTECAPHPMAEKLTICTVDWGGDETCRVVCGAPNVKAGLKVIFARVGATIPSTKETLKKMPLRGVMSEGMILSAAEMGWMDKAVGIVECPKKAPTGDPAPLDPPPDLAMADPAAKKKKSKKEGKKDKKDDRKDKKKEESPEPEEKEEDVLAGMTKKKKKKAVLEEPEPEPEPEPGRSGRSRSRSPARSGVGQEEEEEGRAAGRRRRRGTTISTRCSRSWTSTCRRRGPRGSRRRRRSGARRRSAEAAAAAAAEGGDGAAADAGAAGGGAPAGGDGESTWEKQLEELEALQASGTKLDDSQKNKLKKLKKRAKEKAAKEEKGDSAKSKGPKPSAAVLKMQEELRLREEAAAAAAAAEAERLAKEKAEEEALAAAEAEAEAKRAAKKEKERLKKEKLRAEGKLLTAKQKEEKRRMEAMREQLLQRTDSSGALDADSGDAPAAPKRTLVDDRKKKKEMLERRRLQEEAAAKAAAEAAAEAMAEEAKAAAEAAAEEAAAGDASDDAEDDWDAVDNLDDLVKIPNKAEEEAREKAALEEAARAAAEAKAKAKAEKEAKEAALAAKKEEAAAAKAALSAAAKAKHAAAKSASPASARAAAEADSEEDSEEDSDSGSDSDASGSGSDSDASDSDSDSDGSSEYSSSEYSSSEYDSEEEREREFQERMRAAKKARLDRFEARRLARSKDRLRCPIICILGHVDTGKTKILDNIRRTNVQDGEAGGITQQIGATFIPDQSILERTRPVNKGELDLRVPGLLVIDTPGHESFTNLRSRGSSLCDLAILVVDIMHGLEPQTLESLNMLRMRKTPFIIALNKIDRMYDWEARDNYATRDTLALQKKHARLEYEDRAKKVMLEFANEGLNAAIYWENPDVRKFINVVPTSAITGEGIPDMIHTLVDLTQTRMNEKLQFFDAVQCTVLEVKMIEGLGTTMDVILINGTLREGQTIVVAGLQGAIVTTIRALLTPQPLREMRVKANYQHHKEISAAMGIKIVAQGLEQAVAGTSLLVQEPEDDLDELKEEVLSDMKNVMGRIDKTGEGVYVQASTLGSLEALLEFLKSDAVKIPVAGIAIGPVNKRDVMGASVMHERKRPEFATILAFDVPVTAEATKMAKELDVRIMTADIIYHLFDQFTAYMAEIKQKKKDAAAELVSFPCELKIMPNCIFNKRDPIVVGVDVVRGIARVGTQICIPSQGFMDIGKIASMELNHKQVDKATPGQSVAMKIQPGTATESSRLYGRHFDHKDVLVSHITRQSIDMLKENFRDELSKDDWRLVVELKKKFELHTGEPM